MKRILTYVVLTFLLFMCSTTVYAETLPDENYLEDISDFYIINQSLLSNDGSRLVPRNAVRGDTDEYEIIFQYEVIVKSGINVQASVEDLVFSKTGLDEQTLESVFQFAFQQRIVETFEYRPHMFTETVVANRVVVRLTVSMDTPKSFEIAQQLMGGQLSFEVQFVAI